MCQQKRNLCEMEAHHITPWQKSGQTSKIAKYFAKNKIWEIKIPVCFLKNNVLFLQSKVFLSK